MPEIPLCIHCRKSIDEEKDEYVITNKAEVRYTHEWLYAHRVCQDIAMEEEKA